MEELIQSVFEALNTEPIRPDGVFTTTEFQEELNKRFSCGRRKTLDILRKLKQGGRIVVIERVPLVDVSDRATFVKGWKLVKNNEQSN